ncbi:MAG: glycosyltransferase [Candidatus Levybacteria bacterium]|nr:glycosyltransferase [Candidatus Levybacteria bacterium]MBI2622703.1 glycosyltransferase [Candidatus Levybacteria bacterium]MBI3069872.1 glycosyltransferase [Candidatus Levybacteria bacterium]
MKSGVSAIVPAYNEEKKIKGVLKALTRSSYVNEIICINDGSTDKTLKILQSTPEITIINLKRNRGKGFAVARGIEKAKGEVILLIDADIRGLNDKHIAQLVHTLQSGKYDFAIGYRSSRVEATVGVPLSGERAYFKKDLLPYLKVLEKKGLGALELYLNYQFRDKRKKIIQLKGVYSHSKHKKYSSYRLATKLYAAETYYILNEFIRRRNHLSYFLHSYLAYIYLRS